MRKNLLTLDTIIAKELKYMISAEQFQPGDKLPSERILSERFHVQRPTIRSALDMLLKERCIYAVERRGYFVAEPRIIQYTNSFSQDYFKDIPNVSYRVESFRIIEADMRLSSKMLMPEGTSVYQVIKICYEHKRPIAMETAYVPCDIISEFPIEEIGRHSTVGVIKHSCQHDIANSNQKITLVYTNESESELLILDPGSPVMKHKGLVYDNLGDLVLFFENIMLMERFAFLRKGEDQWNGNQ